MIPLNWLAGFIDGEGSFGIRVSISEDFKHGLSLSPLFEINVVDTVGIMKQIETRLQELGIHTNIRKIIHPSNKNARASTRIKIQDLASCRRFFEVFYPLLYVKSKECRIWGDFIALSEAREHLTPQGILRGMDLKEQMQALRSPRKKRKYTYKLVKAILEKGKHL